MSRDAPAPEPMLLVDLGNSRLKWVVSAPSQWEPQAVSLRDADFVALLARHWGGLARPARLIACAVAASGHERTLAQWTAEHWDLSPEFIRPQAQACGVISRYDDPGQLGADRFAALVGARALTRAPVCIIDCGTAVTVDAMTAAGEFLGGVILPGLQLQRSSLMLGTGKIRHVAGDDSSCLGRTTAAAVAAGTLFGLAGAIERIVTEQRRVLGGPVDMLITGGDAEALAPRLSFAARHVPDLVLRGLAQLAAAGVGTAP